ncbi:PilZ domain-containing protein [Geobacter sp.]|uniref:PilZ domain-containing protein n=1 Tax=Geobacter sp. TaxID=46610 RepID=UPI001AD0A704|nr:PilZ domain-containing protein [Geobacter sp.]CAG0981445.1 hypothetical protein GEOBC_01843 [Geobacteraceae bacterium]
MGSMERRRHPRVPFSAPAFLEKDSRITYGEVRDISLHGLYLSVRGDHEPDEEALVSIYFLSGSSTLTITVPGRIVRSGSDGIGFASPHLDPLQLLSYESVLSFGYDPPQLMEEFLSHADTLAPGKEGVVT